MIEIYNNNKIFNAVLKNIFKNLYKTYQFFVLTRYQIHVELNHKILFVLDNTHLNYNHWTEKLRCFRLNECVKSTVGLRPRKICNF